MMDINQCGIGTPRLSMELNINIWIVKNLKKLVTMMMDAYPDHDLTEWLKRGFAMNEGDSTISFSSLD